MSAFLSEQLAAFSRCEGPNGVGCVLDVPIVFQAAVALGLGIVMWILTRLTGNDSWVDRFWSIIPPFFALDNLRAAGKGGCLTPDGAVSAKGAFVLLILLWGARLTYNFWRKGGYAPGGEDYRWEAVRKMPGLRNPIVWQLFSFWFISIFQCLLLWSLTLPLFALPANRTPTVWEAVCAAGLAVCLLLESMADEQQWAFQCGKRKLGPRRAAWASDYARGFLTHGLWGYSRHPNVSCEQLIWVWVSMAAVPAFGALNFTSAGAVTLILLTVRSTFLTEAISSAKYPAYRRYQDLVPMFWPLAGSTNLDEIERAE